MAMEPTARMKQLVEMSHNISVERHISINRYFNSGRELIKSATAYEEQGDIEKAFVLYLRYMTLFLEKLPQHPEYVKADKAEKALVKKECNNIFDLAERLKTRIKEKFEQEYERSKCSSNIQDSDNRSKRCIEGEETPIFRNEIDELDAKFDFSQQSVDCTQDKVFDPFNIEELKQSFDAPRK